MGTIINIADKVRSRRLSNSPSTPDLVELVVSLECLIGSLAHQLDQCASIIETLPQSPRRNALESHHSHLSWLLCEARHNNLAIGMLGARAAGNRK
jgi:hypothetical protein